MSATVIFHDNAGRNRNITIDFVSERQAMLFVKTFQCFGGITQFQWDFVSTSSSRKNRYLKSSVELYKSLMVALLDDRYYWVTYIDCRQAGRYNYFCINGWDSKTAPMHVRVLWMEDLENM